MQANFNYIKAPAKRPAQQRTTEQQARYDKRKPWQRTDKRGMQ